MISFFSSSINTIYAVDHKERFEQKDIAKLNWLFGNSNYINATSISGQYIGPRREMITPWSTNAVEITISMGLGGIERIEQFTHKVHSSNFDPMLEMAYSDLNQEIFTINIEPEPILDIQNIKEYNKTEGLALTDDEVEYLESVSKQLARPLTDGEVFGFSQVNSEHCRHKIFNGTFIIDGREKDKTLFQLIKETSKRHPNKIVSAYKDNVAFIEGPQIEQFAPMTQVHADFFKIKQIDSVISLKAETHNFPTTVEPFNGAATGSGGEIRDRLAGGRGSLPLAGTAVYMTSYTRLEENRLWEKDIKEREWLYQTPVDILIKASDGASDFGNKFGQPLICGSVLTFEHFNLSKKFGYDKVIMMAGGVGFGKKSQAQKDKVSKGEKVIVLGGDNYRIGMGGGAVSSVATGEFSNKIELNAVQRSNPEMQKRVMNALRGLQEDDNNPIVSIHDHGAGGHLNCLSELLEETGGVIDVDKLPIGDPTLSEKEIIGNESQERMGLILKGKDVEKLRIIAERERSPMYVVGESTGDHKFTFKGKSGKNPIDWELAHMFGSSPKTILKDSTVTFSNAEMNYDNSQFENYLKNLIQLESVGCKDWLTNKVDRSVTGKVATQQTCGSIQLPLNNVAVMALDFNTKKGVATSIGHAPVASLIDPAEGAKMAIAETLTNLVFAQLTHGLEGVSLSANWMWPAKVEGENHRLYNAVEAAAEFAIDLGINIPTGKDSLSMTQKYGSGDLVHSPGTVIISSVGEVEDITKTVTTNLKNVEDSFIYFIDFSGSEKSLGGSAFSQVINQLGNTSPKIKGSAYFIKTFAAMQSLIKEDKIYAGHDVGSGGLIVSLLEMCFPENKRSLSCEVESDLDISTFFFSENPGVLIQASENCEAYLKKESVSYIKLGKVEKGDNLKLKFNQESIVLNIEEYRKLWFKTSYLLDKKQRDPKHAESRFNNFSLQPLEYTFPKSFDGTFSALGLTPSRKDLTGIKAAIIREKGVNGDREMAWAMHLAGFDVKDIHMTDLVAGREDLSDVNFIVFVGGFSNSDVLGSAKGWAGAFLYNEKAKNALTNFYKREDTLSLGVCNGCQLMMELGLVFPELENHPKMKHNSSGKFESSFVNLNIPKNNSVLLSSLEGTRMGAWLAHGEGRFELSESETIIVAKYSYEAYPGNPNGSDYSAAAVCSTNGRHLAIMPHIERSIYPWNWANYPEDRINDEVSPWITPFINAKNWIEHKLNNR